MRTIYPLQDTLINQIAAGEVIEQPASCVKELVENSLDAGATSISVHIEGGGELLISIEDNGSGMSKEDLLVACCRHATSKISSFDDLYSLPSFGFRGEALASISSVSELSIFSKQEEQQGHFLLMKKGEVAAFEETTCLQGTKIEVKNLFYNVPARKKFLRSPSSNRQSIIKSMTQIALANEKVAFSLVIDQKRIFSLPASSLKERISALLGDAFLSSLLPVDFQTPTLSLTGYISKPQETRTTRQQQYLFLNKRPITSPLLSFALKTSYGTSIESNKFPCCILFLSTSGSHVDINVHPQKKEVRFRDEDAIKRALIESCSQTLFYPTHQPTQKPQIHSPSTISFSPASFSIDLPPPPPARKEEQQAFTFEKEPLSFKILATFKEFALLDTSFLEEPPQNLQGEGIVLCNIEYALRRIAHDTLNKTAPEIPPSEQLLVPYFLEFSKPEAALIETIIPDLSRLGFSLRPFGSHAFLVESSPLPLNEKELKELFHTLATEGGSAEQLIRSFSRRGKEKYIPSPESAQKIIGNLLQCDSIFICPFGNPIFSLLCREELEAKFVR